MHMLTADNWNQWSELQHWLEPLPQGEKALLDPAVGTRLHPDRPHEWIAADERLQEGFAFLARRGVQTTVTLVYGRHYESEDLGDPSKQWFERQVASHDAYALEAPAWDKAQYSRIIGTLATNSTVKLKDDYLLRQLLAISRSRTPSFSFDVEATDRPLDKLLNQLTDNKITPLLNEEGLPADFAEWAVVVSAIREWYMIGKLGKELADMPDLPENAKILMTVGSGHRDLTRKLRLFNVRVLPKMVRPKVARIASSGIARALRTATFPARASSLFE